MRIAYGQVAVCLSIVICFTLYVFGATVDKQRCLNEASWGPWRCPGDERRCSGSNATRYRCIGGNCTQTDTCALEPGFQEERACKKTLEDGRCVPWWALWSTWTQCSALCGVAERTRFRPCIGAWNYRNAQPRDRVDLLQSCAVSSRAGEGIEHLQCPIRRICPNVNGAWGEWGSFTLCTITCGAGLRIRMRRCNRPIPRGTGLPCQGIDTQQVHCDGPIPCPKRGEWCPWSSVVTRCSSPCGPIGMGLRSRLCACPRPSHGGESCSIPPGTEDFADYESQTKTGTIPKPNAFAIQAIRTGQGRWEACNRHPCPYLKFLSDKEKETLRHDLLRQKATDAWVWSAGIPASRDDPVQLHCPPEKRSRKQVFDVYVRFPLAQAYWTKSVPKSPLTPTDYPGVKLAGTKNILIEGDTLTIRALQPSATGIYRYGYEYDPGMFETVCFFPVYINESVWEILHGSTFDLTCHALGMWPVMQVPKSGSWHVYWEIQLDKQLADTKTDNRWWYTDMMRVFNVEEEAEYNKTTNDTERDNQIGTGFTAWDTEYRRIYGAKESMSGRYTCLVYNKVNRSYDRTFVMESFHLIVRPPPSVFQLFRVWCTRNQWHLLVLVIVGLVSSLICALCLWRRSQNIARLELQTREMNKTKKALNLADLDAKVE